MDDRIGVVGSFIPVAALPDMVGPVGHDEVNAQVNHPQHVVDHIPVIRVIEPHQRNSLGGLPAPDTMSEPGLPLHTKQCLI